ncbi:MAG: response regulator [Desulfobacterales bacterium]|nr:response regulator [Desulfobacterales bacterium]
MSKILAIDDKQDNLTVLTALLNNFIPDCVVITAMSGIEGIEKAKTEQPDIILLDIKMPDMDGYEVCRILKSDKTTDSVPIIMLTALKTDAKSRIKALELGADAFLTKPVDHSELIAQVKVMLRIKESEDKLKNEKKSLEHEVLEKILAHYESELQFEELFENMPIGAALYEAVDNGNGFIIRDVNRSAEKMDSISKKDVIGKSVTEKDPGIKQFGLFEILQRVWKTGNLEKFPIARYEDERLTGWRQNHISKLPSGEIVAIFSDETERRQAEEALRDSEERFRQMAENINEVFWMKDVSTGKIIYASPAYEDIWQQSVSELYENPKKWTEHIHSDDLEIISSNMKKQAKGHFTYEEFRIILPGSSVRWIANRSYPIQNKKGKIYRVTGIAEDITDMKQAVEEKMKVEDQLRHAQKMEAIGVLAGGIAHDFNNILFPLIGFAEMSQEELPEDSPAHEFLKEVLDGANRAKELVRQILTFSRRQDKQEIEPVKVQLILKEVFKLLKSTLPTTIEIRQSIDNDCGMVLADPTHIHQIIMNLVTNAYHAMQKTCGLLEITLKQVDSEYRDIKDLDLKSRQYACLTVADTGVGMDKSVLGKIFDPYFTTKEKGRGTGLGLSVVSGIVRSCRGEITVDSTPGKGSVFNVYLPVTEEESEKLEEPAEPLTKGTEHILIVDDQESIIQLQRHILERLGYHVTAFCSSTDALEEFRTNPDKFDLLITDMTMPDMRGDQLAQEFMNIRDDIPVIICTGYSELISREKAKAMGVREFIMKPVNKKQFAGIVQKVLET